MDFKLQSIAADCHLDNVNVNGFLGNNKNPFDRPSALQAKIASFEAGEFDEEFTRTGDSPKLTAASLKASKVITRDNNDLTLFTDEARIYMTMSYYGRKHEETFPLCPKEYFNNEVPTAYAVFDALVTAIDQHQAYHGFGQAVRDAYVRGAGVACTRALLHSEVADMQMVNAFYTSLPPYKVAAANDLQGARIIDSHAADPFAIVAIFLYEVLQVLKTVDLHATVEIETSFPALATGAQGGRNDHSHEARRVMGVLVEQLDLGRCLKEQNYVVVDGRHVGGHGLFFVVKKTPCANKIASALMATLLLIQERDDSLVLSGEFRTKLLLRDFRSFLGAYSFVDALKTGYLPNLHYRMLVPLARPLDRDAYTAAIGTLATNPDFRPKRKNQALAKMCPSGFFEFLVGTSLGSASNWDFPATGLRGIGLADIPTPEYNCQSTYDDFVPRRLLNAAGANTRGVRFWYELHEMPRQLSEDREGIYKVVRSNSFVDPKWRRNLAGE